MYVIARPPLYERDGFMYHLFGRDFLAGTNPHHLLWNGVQALIVRTDALLGIDSVLPFQLVGMLCGVASAVLLYQLLLQLASREIFAFAAALFVALAPWTWFMAFQNQPYALMLLLFIVFLGAFASSTGEMARGSCFALAAASAVGMVALQQAAVLIVAGAAVCFFFLAGLRRAITWIAATGVPTAAMYVLLGAMKGVRNVPSFWRWVTAYLHSQHSLQTRFPDSLAQSVMGLISAFVNQESFKELLVDTWSAPTILWFYGTIGICLLAVIGIRLRRSGITPSGDTSSRPIVWISLASILSWGVFCFFWEPTNYYWFILLGPVFVYVAAVVRLTPATERIVAASLGVVSAWNVFANHTLDAAGARRAPEPQMHVIEQHLRPNDLLWVVDLGWKDDIDYDLLSSTAAFEHAGTIRAVSDVVGASRDDAEWQRALEDSSRRVIARGGRVFLSDRVFDPDSFDRSWEQSPFADYQVERTHRIDWPKLARELPTFVEQNYTILPAGFLIGSDTIWRLEPHDTKR